MENHESYRKSSRKKREYFQLFYEVSITVIPKAGKNITRKENYRSISLRNIDVQVLDKILSKKVQQHSL